MHINEIIVYLKTQKGLGYRRIAKELRMTVAAVSNRWHRHRPITLDTDKRPTVAYVPGIQSRYYKMRTA